MILIYYYIKKNWKFFLIFIFFLKKPNIFGRQCVAPIQDQKKSRTYNNSLGVGDKNFFTFTYSLEKKSYIFYTQNKPN